MDVEVLDTDRVDQPTRVELRELWARAFGGRFTDDDADHAYGGVHVLARAGTSSSRHRSPSPSPSHRRLAGHASAVPRRIRFGNQPWRTVGYVEAVATAPERQGEGVGQLVMTTLQREIARRWPVALLSTGRATGFYEQLGWERWRGPSFTQTADGIVPDGEHGGIMILRCDPAAVPDLSVAVTCEDRHGDAW